MRLKGLSLPEGLSQQGVERRVRALAAENTVYPTILRGAGEYKKPKAKKSKAREELPA